MALSAEAFALNLMTQTIDIKSFEFSEALNKGRLDFALAFINTPHPDHHSQDRFMALKISIEKGAIELAQAIIALNDFTSDAQREEALKNAFLKNQCAVVAAMLATGPFSKTFIRQLLSMLKIGFFVDPLMFSMLLTYAELDDDFIEDLVSCSIFTTSIPHLDIIMSRGLATPIHLQKVCEASARFGKLPILQFLLSRISMSQELIDELIIQATVFAQVDILQFLLSQGCNPTSLKRKQAILQVSACVDFDKASLFVQKLLELDPPLTFGVLQKEVFKNASSKGNFQLVQALCGAYGFSESDIIHAIVLASSQGHAHVLEFLLEKVFPSEDARHQAFLDAALKGYDRIISVWLDHSSSIPEHIIRQALISATAKGNLGVVLCLLSRGLIHPDMRIIALEESLDSKKIDVLHELLKMGPLDREFVAKMISRSISQKKNHVFKAYCDCGFLDQSLILRSLNQAADQGCLSIVEVIFAHMDIAKSHRHDAMMRAVEGGHLDVLQYLIAKEPISLVFRGQLVLKAVNFKKAHTLTYLLTNGPILPADRQVALRRALSSELSLNLVQMLQQQAAASEGDGGPLAHRLIVLSSHLREQPYGYLLDVTQDGLRSVRYINPDGSEQAGIDAGGLTKQFVHDLLDALTLNGFIPLNEHRVPTKSELGCEETWKLIGQFLSIIEEKNIGKHDLIFTGQIFDKKTLKLLKIVLDDSLSEKQKLVFVANSLQNELTSRLVEFVNLEAPSEEDRLQIIDYLNQIHMDDFSALSLSELHDLCLSHFKNNTFVALKALASGLKDPLKSNILAHGASYGSVLFGPDLPSVEQIFSKLVPAADNAELIQKVEWLKNKISHEFEIDDSSWIKRFLICVTGQPVIPAGHISIRGIDGFVCKAHTCTNVLDVPISLDTPHIVDASLSDQERFIRNLEITMSTHVVDST